ncbi:hypothetical protein [Anatilimnocola floriformis]|uniref:hypothetical protein n=1 Tax=Anatilimnocola floriformis TaxID=2948575 RepID=UPI0020C396AF|nr:hypothetical protein [Anatilimnocola floriformis]
MTFSIRTFLIVIAILACWLGAMVSTSLVIVELVASATLLLMLLALPLAIWEPRAELRAFWTGFFVLSLGSILLSSYLGGYQQTSQAIAVAILGQPTPVQYPQPNFSLPPGTVPLLSPPQPGSFRPTPADTEPSLPEITPGDDSPASNKPSLNTSYYQPPLNPYNPVPIYASPNFVPYAQYGVADRYYLRVNAIRSSVPYLFSLLAGVIGGWVTMWVYRRAKSSAAETGLATVS